MLAALTKSVYEGLQWPVVGPVFKKHTAAASHTKTCVTSFFTVSQARWHKAVHLQIFVTDHVCSTSFKMNEFKGRVAE